MGATDSMATARPTAAPIVVALPMVIPRRVLATLRRSDRDAAARITGWSRAVSRVNCRTMAGCKGNRRAGAPVLAAPARASSGGCAQLAAFGLEHVVQAPFGELDAGREPEISGLP